MSSFEPIRTDVQFDVNVGQTRADLTEIRRVYAQTTGAMSDEALRLAVAQEKLNRTLARTGAESTATKNAALQYRGALQAVAAEAERASIAAQRAAERQAAAQLRAAQTVGHALTRYVAAPTALIAFEAVKMGVQFNRQMLMIQTQAGASAEEVANLHDQVLALARVSPQSPEELAKGLYHLESLGLRGAQAMGVLKTSSTAAFMGIADLESVTTALGGAVVTGIKGTENFDRAMGTLNATIGAGNMRMEDLTSALGTGVLPAAKNAGLSLDQVGAALAVLTDRGMGADESATRFKMTLALMEAPTRKAQKALRDMGVDGRDLNAMLRQPDGLLKVLELLHSRMDAVGKTRGSRDIIQAFGGGRSSAAILTLIQSLDSAISSYQGKLADVRRNTDKFFADQHDVKKSDAYKLATAWSSVQVDLVKLGATLTPIVTTAADGLAKIADGFDHLGKVGKTELEVIIGLLAIGGPLLLVVAATIKSVQTIGTAFKLIPAQAGPAIATTDAELVGLGATAERTALQVGAAAGATEAGLAGIGGAAAAAEGSVGLLSTSLLGLGAIAIAPIVIPILMEQIWNQDNPGYTPTKQAGGGTGSVLGHATHIGSEGVTIEANGNTSYTFGPDGVSENYKHGAISGTKKISFADAAKALGVTEKRLREALANTTSPASATVAKPLAGHSFRDANLNTPYTPPGEGTTVPYKPSRAADLNLALAKNPNDVAAIKAKIAYDREAAAFAQRRIAAGRGTPKLEQQLQAVYSDINSLEGQLTSMQTTATSKAAEAARKAAELAKQTREKLARERQALVTRLTQVPVSLQIAEVQAELHHASEARLRKIYERELAAVKEQLVTLRKIGATKADQLNAMNTELSIQQKIDGLQKSSSASTKSIFDQAAEEFLLYGSDIAGAGGILSPQDARGATALAVLKEISRKLDKANHNASRTATNTGKTARARRRPIDDAQYAAVHGW